MKGTLQMEVKGDNEIACKVNLEQVSMIDKAALLKAFFQGIEVDDDEVDMLVMIAKMIGARKEKL